MGKPSGYWLVSLLGRTPVRSFVLMPIAVIAFESVWRRGAPAFDPWGLPLLAWGYLQYRLVGHFRTAHGGGGPGIDRPPSRLVTEGPYRFTRNPMYLGHLIFFTGLAIMFRSYLALVLLASQAVWFHARVLADERRLMARFGADYKQYMRRVRRWVPGVW
jgi:protein-S-isoprenylcysteine O-methyltransferase Ste14